MRIVIDTNVLIFSVFFGGFPRKILSSIVAKEVTAYATAEIINEYEETIHEMINRKQGHISRSILTPFIKSIEIIKPISHIEICRDPDDNKFLECAKDSHAVYIVSGDKDLLVIENYENIQIVTAKNFCKEFL
ncbi:MAG: putative toxin-antitoxin system toxin component, PIN family [bacterium]|nr:putative toxin-antitoxin system toxin component, PIN family [bacterium]MCM1375463.1 putative toxin-antitoxin system toxin component, PIN family [Muribaculum sp.]